MAAEKVYLYVYDLSQGMARIMSLNLTGQQIDGIWHTSVVAYGREWYFGQGIFNSVPGVHHYGHPIEKIDMGETFITRNLYTEFINNIRPRYTPTHYHLLHHNCNTFTDEVCQFLVGKNIPKHITSLPSDFLNTPFGQMMRPAIDSFFSSPRTDTTPKATHPHLSIKLLSLRELTTHPIKYDAVSDKMFDKLESVVKAGGLTIGITQIRKPLKNPNDYSTAVQSVVQLLSSATDWNEQWIFMDLLRCVASDEQSTKQLLPSFFTACKCIEQLPELTTATTLTPSSLHLLTTTLRAATNITSHSTLTLPIIMHMSNNDNTAIMVEYRTVLSALLVLGLLHTEKSVRVAASGVAFNIGRTQMKYVDARQTDLSSSLVWDAAGEHEEWMMEIVSACVNCLQQESDVEVAERIVVAIGCFLFTAPSSILELVKVLDLSSVLRNQLVASGASVKLREICAEVEDEIAA